MDNGSTVQLLYRCGRDGDEAAWEHFARRIGPRLDAGIRQVLAGAGQGLERDRVEELRQEVFCRLLERDRHLLRGFRGSSEGEAVAYLGRVVRSAVIDQLRAQGAAKRGERLRISLNLLHADEAQPREPMPGPEEQLLARERRREALTRCWRAAGRRISPRTRRILGLALLHGFTSREIAASAIGRGLSRSTIDSMVSRARQRLAGAGIALPRR